VAELELLTLILEIMPKEKTELKETTNPPLLIADVINWVAVEDSLPPAYFGDVLVYLTETKLVRLAWYQPWTGCWWFTTSSNKKTGISHWAEIPKPPCL
jgi:hypothetical protein